MTYSVVAIDDDQRFLASLIKAIDSSNDLRVIGVAEDFLQGKLLLETLQPDVALVDLGLPMGSGVDLIRYARISLPNCKIMVITIFADEEIFIECVEAGATGYLLKGASTEDINKQIRALISGGSPLSPGIARLLLKRLANTAEPIGLKPKLSAQELLVLNMSAKGYTYDEIASLLSLSRHTVSTYVKRVYKKLQVHSKTEAVYEARKHGLTTD